MENNEIKHLGYYNLIETLNEEGCPVCNLLERSVRRYMSSLLYESVNDPWVRKRLREASGFCNTHAWQLKRLGDGLGQSIIYEDLVSSVIALMKNMKKSGASTKGFRNGLKRSRSKGTLSFRKKGCPVCSQKSQTEDRIILVFIRSFKELEFSRLFQDSFGLCLPHLFLALDKGEKDEAFVSDLLEIELGKMESLTEELREYQRKQDYRYIREGFGAEGDSWVRAIEKLVGREGIN
jgi:hypothetical protein